MSRRPTQALVLDELRGGPASGGALAVRAGCSVSGVVRRLWELEKRGKVERIPGGIAPKWRLKEAGDA